MQQLLLLILLDLLKGLLKVKDWEINFFSHVREVDTIIHLTRCFESENTKRK